MMPPPLPKYYQLTQVLREQITSGHMRPGDQLPTEDTLCRAHRVSRGTVRKAIEVLIQEGYIRRSQGSGTFVHTTQPSTTLLTLSNFDEDIRRQNRTPTARLLIAEVLPASPAVAAQLELIAETPIIHIARLRLADQQIVAYEERYLAESLCPHLLQEDLETHSIHHLLVHTYRIPLVKMVHTVELGHLSDEQAQLLHAEPHSDAFFIDRLTFSKHEGRRFPAVWYRAIYGEDHYHIEARVQTSL
ncbi:MAG: hypothetical protein GFH27_549305n72 [Chloroflexi bacterium AL-W]|nr:hypothetical protein [Chloroflexi bacterium AL-N1]NOK69318.1 hypothetical protein [Chloroflexi bacterium AL-N10]NOK76379.1 hypothetical protein [Chloroflexi bacterium AL-N5]NOK83496.1 hypothetical protein [Chloroflexi bacterium AL-W]NOK91156.1 hypothetical protein [Chloroflexi bacterium AL-N15]